ncbi:MAG: translation elongation factor 4 [Mycoplasmoidaceae bacterium]
MENKIRNFSIIAHIDHGKSTLSDRIIEITKGLEVREMKNQVLDSMDIERERGITIKLNAIQLKYVAKDLNEYIFHLIDTPGHVDFSYEVSRSLAACEGALLVIDASQGIEAQTLSNVYLALENNLEIIPVINKIDLPTANVVAIKKQIEDIIGIDCSNVPLVSAKTGLNILDVLEAVVSKIPHPKEGLLNKNLKALIFDSYYDKYKGVVCLIRIFEGEIKIGMKIKFMSNDATYVVSELGVSTPKLINKESLTPGIVGWFSASIKNIKEINVGDTITGFFDSAIEPLKGYKKILPMVFCGLYPIDTSQSEYFKDALEKISLSDSSLIYNYETSKALGFGIRCGFLGLLHMEVITERIRREFNIELISSAPSVSYKVFLTNGDILNIDSPYKMPEPTKIKEIHEPIIRAEIITPSEYIGNCMTLCQDSRGIYIDLILIDESRRKLVYEIPLSEIIYYFFDSLKSISKGYATLDYSIIGYKKDALVKVDILINGIKVDALSTIYHKNFAASRSRIICKKLTEAIPKQLFEVPIQATIGGKIIARETIPAMRKNVLAKCYGGDITRKKKLLEQQKEGKKKMKAIGNVQVPQDTFIKILSNKKIED